MKRGNSKIQRLHKQAESTGILFGLLAFISLGLAFILSVETWSWNWYLIAMPILLLVGAFVFSNIIEGLLNSAIRFYGSLWHRRHN